MRRQSMIRPVPELSWPPGSGELAIYDARDGQYHVLNPSAAAIWRAIAAGTPVAQIASELAEHYGIAVETIQADVDAFVAQALQLGLLIDG